MSKKEIRPEIFADDDVKWVKLISEIQSESIASIEEVAKQLIGLDGIISGIYFGAISFSQLTQNIPNIWERLALTIPIVFWLFSLLAAVITITPREYHLNPNKPVEAKNTYNKIIRAKRLFLSIALWLFVLSIGALILVLLIYLYSI